MLRTSPMSLASSSSSSSWQRCVSFQHQISTSRTGGRALWHSQLITSRLCFLTNYGKQARIITKDPEGNSKSQLDPSPWFPGSETCLLDESRTTSLTRSQMTHCLCQQDFGLRDGDNLRRGDISENLGPYSLFPATGNDLYVQF